MEKAKIWPPGVPKHMNGFRWNLDYITGLRVWPHMQIHVPLRQRGWFGRTREKTLISISLNTTVQAVTSCDYKNKNWFQFLFIVKAAVLKLQISKFYPQIISTEDSFYIYERPLTEINVIASFCALITFISVKICILSKLLLRLQPNFAQSQRPPSTLRGWSQHA